MNNSAAAAYANCGAGGHRASTSPERGITKFSVALRIMRGRDAAADAQSRCALQVKARGPGPTCELREKSRKAVATKCGEMKVGMMASGDKSDSWRSLFSSPSNSFFGGKHPPGELRRPLPRDMVDLVAGHLPRTRGSECGGVLRTAAFRT